MKALQVVRSAYRCTIEEQDDPAVWISHAMRGGGAELGVLLCGNAVNYAVNGQDASGLSFGGVQQTQPPRLQRDIAALIDKGVPVYAVEEDAAARGIAVAAMLSSVRSLSRSELPQMFGRYDQIWHW